MCFYYVALWSNYLSHDFQKFSSAYMKCLKLFFFAFHKCSSVSAMFMELRLPTCGTTTTTV